MAGEAAELGLSDVPLAAAIYASIVPDTRPAATVGQVWDGRVTTILGESKSSVKILNTAARLEKLQAHTHQQAGASDAEEARTEK
eukprot:evm.model.NODE_24746_length_14822_cov_25.019632.3